MNLNNFPAELARAIDWTLAKPSRVHRLPSFESGNVWIKREDELSSGVTGSKMRKYASLIPYLISNRITKVGLIGGPNSNNLVGLVQLLKENAIQPIAFIRKAADSRKTGNALLLDLLLNEQERFVIKREDWTSVSEIAEEQLRDVPASMVIPEGCLCPAALPGCLTLAYDILRNEVEQSSFFPRIYIDSGTGLTAMGLILGLAYLSPSTIQEREIVITLIAGSENTFNETLDQMLQTLRRSFSTEVKSLPNIRFLSPTISPKFGSVNQSLFIACKQIASQEGLLMDPTYSVKHYETSKNDIQTNPPSEPTLFIFNGSPLGLAGFQDRLSLPFRS